MSEWRLGRKVPINVYDGDRPVCQCHSEIDARTIVMAVNHCKELSLQFPDNSLSDSARVSSQGEDRK